MTLDGKIAPPPTESFERTAGTPPGGWITGELAREHVQELRHQHDAIMVGAGTILRDDPLLTDRTGHPRRRPLLRVILDSRLRLPVESRLLQSVKNGNKIFSLLRTIGLNHPDPEIARTNLFRSIHDVEKMKEISVGVEDQREHFDNVSRFPIGVSS